MNSIVKELKWRGLLKDITNEDKLNLSVKNKAGIYIGFDPTAQSLHIGNLVQIITLMRFAQFGLKPVAVLGGATGMIGDPSGKSSERQLLSNDDLLRNKHFIQKQLENLSSNNGVKFKVVDNLEFYKDMTAIDYLREVGKLININYLLEKESIKSRLDTGISYTEVSYALLQGWDFKKLYEKYDVQIQAGGSDQWGNITTGIEIIRKTISENNNASGLTINLLLKSDGTKFGKSESGAVWLDSTLTKPYDMYNFFYNQTDQDVIKLFKFLTFLTEEQIQKIEKEHFKNPKSRFAQIHLAWEVTKFVHGKEMAEEAEKLNSNKYGVKYWQYRELGRSDLTDEESKMSKTNIDVKSLLEGMQEVNINKKDSEMLFVDLLVEACICTSKREAREFITSKAIRWLDPDSHINIEDEQHIVKDINEKIIFKNVKSKNIIIRKGKKNWYKVNLKS